MEIVTIALLLAILGFLIFLSVRKGDKELKRQEPCGGHGFVVD